MSPFRIATVLLPLLFVTQLALAQDTAAAKSKEKKTRVSLFGGGTYTTFTGSAADSVNLGSRFGGMGGVGVEFMLSRTVGIELQGTILQKGAEVDTVGSFPNLGWRMLYAEFPVLLKVHLAPDAKVRPVLFAGPSIGVELDCKMLILYVSTPLHSTCYALDANGQVVGREKMDVGAHAGLDLYFGKFFLSGRYMMGLTSLLTGSTAPDLKNTGFTFGLGYTF